MSAREDPDHARGRARGVSLWLVPQDPFRERLAGVIGRLATRFGGPTFVPHVTLMAGLAGDESDLVARAQALARELRPFSLRLERVARRDEYFRALSIDAVGGEPLRAAHAAACRHFAHPPSGSSAGESPALVPRGLRRERSSSAPTPPSGPFQPHLSLAYGHLDPAAAEAAGREVSNEVQGRFEAKALHVWRTEGPVEAWRELAVVDFYS